MALPEDPDTIVQRLGDLIDVVHARALKVVLEKYGSGSDELQSAQLRQCFHMAALTSGLADAVEAGMSIEDVEACVKGMLDIMRKDRADKVAPKLRVVPSGGGS